MNWHSMSRLPRRCFPKNIINLFFLFIFACIVAVCMNSRSGKVLALHLIQFLILITLVDCGLCIQSLVKSLRETFLIHRKLLISVESVLLERNYIIRQRLKINRLLRFYACFQLR